MEIPDWLMDLLKPVESKGKPSINVYEGKQLEDLDGMPQARADALDSLDAALEEDQPRRVVPAPVPAAPDEDRWKEMEEEAKKERARPR